MNTDDTLTRESRRSARAAHLRYVIDTTKGLHRERKGKNFSYVTERGRTIKDAKVLERMRALVIPPAWSDVWICPWSNGHVQATGFDTRGRKQYRYHPAWQEVRDEQKYGRLILFAKQLPAIRRRVQRDLQRPGLPREKVLAAVVRLLELTRIRIGNDEYARQNATYGLTTIRNKHAEVHGARVRFDFQGKHQIEHEIEIENSQLAQIVRRCQELPGDELFTYRDDAGHPCDVKSADVNQYLRQIAGREFSAKDYRTWAGTVAAVAELGHAAPPTSSRNAKCVIAKAVENVAARLRNTKAICRKCYIHPAVLVAYEEAQLPRLIAHKHPAIRGLSVPEITALTVLRWHQRRHIKSSVAVNIKPHTTRESAEMINARGK